MYRQNERVWLWTNGLPLVILEKRLGGPRIITSTELPEIPF